MALTNRQIEMLKFCETPRTLKEMCEHWEVSHMTIRKELDRLSIMGMLVEQPFRRRKAKLYKTMYFEEDATVAYNLNRSGRSFAPAALVQDSETEAGFARLGKVPRFVMSQLIVNHGVKEGWPLAVERFIYQGFSVAQLRLLLQAAIEYLEDYHQFLQQLDMMPGWEDKYFNTVFGKHGELFQNDPEIWDMLKANVREFELIVNDTERWRSIMHVGEPLDKIEKLVKKD